MSDKLEFYSTTDLSGVIFADSFELAFFRAGLGGIFDFFAIIFSVAREWVNCAKVLVDDVCVFNGTWFQ